MDHSNTSMSDPVLQSPARGMVGWVLNWPWVWILMGVALLAGCIFATWDAWYDLGITGFYEEESSHILLAPIAFMWIFFTRLSELTKLRYRHQWTGLIVMAIGWYLWSSGYRNQVHTAWHLGAVIVLVGGLVTMVGPEIIYRFLPAFGVLFFLIPVAGERRQQFAGPMQLITAQITQGVCEIFGMNVERQGRWLSYNGVPVAIAEACNGMRMVITLLIVTYLYCFITPIRAYVKILLFVLSPLVAVVCNVIRLVPTVWIFGTKPTKTATDFHDLAGWVMLGIAALMLIGIVQLLRWLELPVDVKKKTPVQSLLSETRLEKNPV